VCAALQRALSACYVGVSMRGALPREGGVGGRAGESAAEPREQPKLTGRWLYAFVYERDERRGRQGSRARGPC